MLNLGIYMEIHYMLNISRWTKFLRYTAELIGLMLGVISTFSFQQLSLLHGDALPAKEQIGLKSKEEDA